MLKGPFNDSGINNARLKRCETKGIITFQEFTLKEGLIHP